MRLLHQMMIGFAAFVLPAVVYAATCSCTEPSIAERYQSAQVVFVGEAKQYIKSDQGPEWTVLRFTSKEAWKGAGTRYTDVLVPTKNGSCSIEILISRTYLVFAKAETDGTLVTTPCMGTKLESEAKEDLQFLRARADATTVRVDVPFSDVPSDYPYQAAIYDLRRNGVISGYPDGSFRPERPVTRAELARILDGSVLPYDFIDRRFQQFSFSDKGLPFSDVPERAWYNLPVRRAFRAGVIEGYRDGTFRPEQSVTVAEASKMVVTALSLELPDLGAVWYERFIKAVTERKAMPQTVRSIEMPISRGELIEMIWRLTEHIENRPFVSTEHLLDRQCLTSLDSDISHVDLRKVRETWLGWYNAERTKRGLRAYRFEPYLNRSAALWSNKAADNGAISHVRPGTSAYYDYAGVKGWFQDLGLEFRNIGGITFTENIGRGPYSCKNERDCTDRFIESIRSTFDFYMNEEDATYRPHFNAIVNPSFEMIGLGVAVKNGQYYLTTHFGTDIVSSPPRLCSVDA